MFHLSIASLLKVNCSLKYLTPGDHFVIKGTADVPGDISSHCWYTAYVGKSPEKQRGIAEGADSEKGEGLCKEEIGVLEEQNWPVW